MRKLLYLCLAGLLALGCTKDKIVTTPCDFQVNVDWVKGSRVQFTITPSNPNATYTYGLLSENYSQFDMSDREKIDWQLLYMNLDYESHVGEDDSASFADRYCYKGARTIKCTAIEPDTNWQLLVFQINPETHEAIGSLYTVPFRTKAVPQVELTFTIQYKDNFFRILPSDKNVTWFWEYETEEKIEDVYVMPFFFYYEIIGMYEEYGFLQYNLSVGDDEWIFPDYDPSIKEGVKYNMVLSACTEDGEICSEVYYADFVYQDGKVTFSSTDFPVVPLAE